MPEENIPLHPGVKIRDEMPYDWPLCATEVLVFVEPAPGNWIVEPRDEEAHEALWNSVLDRIDQECYGLVDDEPLEHDPRIEIIEYPLVVWLKNGEMGEDFYTCFTTGVAEASFNYEVGQAQPEVPEYFLLFMQTIHAKYPDWRVTVVGAMFEDEVTRVANALQELGMETIILTRYCFSTRGFVNLDALLGRE